MCRRYSKIIISLKKLYNKYTCIVKRHSVQYHNVSKVFMHRLCIVTAYKMMR